MALADTVPLSALLKRGAAHSVTLSPTHRLRLPASSTHLNADAAHSSHNLHSYEAGQHGVSSSLLVELTMTEPQPHRRLHRILAQVHPSPTSAPCPSLLPSPTANLSPTPPPSRALRRAVIVTGVRTPFIKSFTAFRSVSSLSLSSAAVSALLTGAALSPAQVDAVVLGNVVVSTSAPNLARETILELHLPPTIPGTTISVACLSGLDAIATAVQQVETGHAHAVVAGGRTRAATRRCRCRRTSPPRWRSTRWAEGTRRAGLAGGELLTGLGMPWTWMPSAPTVSERSTGRTMGYHADLMAEINGITRQAQDEYTAASHQKAARARKDGLLDAEIVPVKTADGTVVSRDNFIRESIDAAKLAALPPVFRPAPLGTVTAASSSGLTDGASAVLVMSEERATALGYPTDVSVRAYVKCGFEPFPQLLLAPALAIPRALREAGLRDADVDLWEIHEAFAGQVLATLKVLQDESWYERVTGKRERVTVDPSKLNVNGGSVALGHPFAATGGRLVTSACNELRRRKARICLISICAAGGMGGVMILERTDQS